MSIPTCCNLPTRPTAPKRRSMLRPTNWHSIFISLPNNTAMAKTAKKTTKTAVKKTAKKAPKKAAKKTAKKASAKPGPKDRSYVNSKQAYEVAYAPKRKTPAKKFASGKKTAKKSWKRMITKPTFVGPDFTRRPVKYERFIRPMGLRYKKANVTHPELGVTVQLPIISVKKNPQNPLYTQLGVLTKGTIIEVNVSELGIVTAGGKVVWGRWAQITNNCENDGCVNA